MARTRKPAPEVAGSVAAQPADALPSSGEAAAPKRGRGAPRKNQNRTTHGRYRATKGPIRRTPLHPDEYDAPARVKAREVYRGLGREWAPERETYRELYGAKLRGRARLDLRGWYDGRGEQKEAAKQWFELVERLEAMERRAREAKAQLDGGTPDSEADARAKIAALAGRWPGALTFRILAADGSDLTNAFAGRPSPPMLADPLAADPLALPSSTKAPAVNGTLLPAHPLDRREPPIPEPVPTTPRTIDVETPLQRNWRLGLSPDGDDD